MKRIMMITTLAVMFAAALFAADKGIPAAFVDIGLSRPSAMGGAFTAVADDASAVFYNPAGIATAESADATFMYTKQKWLIPYNIFSIIYPLSKLRGIGFGMIISGDELLSEKTFILSYCESLDSYQPWIKGMNFGMNVKMHLASYGNEEDTTPGQVYGSAFGFGMDFGFIYTVTSTLQFGAMIKDGFSYINWDSNLRDTTDMEGIPLTSSIGIRYKYKPIRIRGVQVIASGEVENFDKLRLGVELTSFKYLDLRVGMTQELDYESYREYSVGMGIGHFEMGARKEMSVNFDFGYTFERLDGTLKIQTSFKFK